MKEDQKDGKLFAVKGNPKAKEEYKQPEFTVGAFDHSIMTDDLASCGIEMDVFNAKNGKMNDIVAGIDGNKNFISQLTEQIEATFTPREIAFMAAKLSYVNMVNALMVAQSQPQQPQSQIQKVKK